MATATRSQPRSRTTSAPRRRPGPRSTPQGRHARSGPNAPATGRHAAPARQAPAQPPPKRARPGFDLGGKAGAAGAGAQDQAGRGIATVQAGLGQGGQHALAAELLLFVGIVALRAVATYGPAPKGGKDLPADQYGPLFILGNGFVAFFVLAFLAARGGTAAKVAVAGGLIIDVALLLKSVPHLDQLAAVYAEPRKYVPENLGGTYQTGEADVLTPALAYELQQRKLPPQSTAATGSAQSYARKSLTAFGLKLTEFPLLVKLWNAESGWRVNATNPSSGAYGIPQALPADKMASAGADWRTNKYTQIKWGLGYIRQRYGSIAAAWAHETHFGWY